MDKKTKTGVFGGGTSGEFGGGTADANFNRAANAIPGEPGEVARPARLPKTVSTAGLNASVMTQKKVVQKRSMATGEGDEDDPVGLILRPPQEADGTQPGPKMCEVMISAGQFPVSDDDEPKAREMSTQYDPPGGDDDDDGLITKVTSHPTILSSQAKYQSHYDEHADKLLKKMEYEMTQGRRGAGPSNAIDEMLSQMS